MWIGLINGDAEKAGVCEHFLEMARNGEVEIWGSSLILAEVFKKKCGAVTVAIDPAKDADFERFVEQSFVVEVQVDHDIGVLARSLLRAHQELKKPADAIHLASAAHYDIDEFHTFDDDNLVPLDGKVTCKNGKKLHILKPKIPKDTQMKLEMKQSEPVETAKNDEPASESLEPSQAAGASSGNRSPAQNVEHPTQTAQPQANEAQAKG